ncbi:MAG: hypothetical protein QOH63_2003 [Acidobacteriota bacterium]|jgi:hypothetical protein|nr:hypothetical protein [Acidobacteriota bacterium]
MTVISLLDQTVAKLNRLCRAIAPSGARYCSDCEAIEVGDIENGAIERGTIHHKPNCTVLMLTTKLSEYRARVEDLIELFDFEDKANSTAGKVES